MTTQTLKCQSVVPVKTAETGELSLRFDKLVIAIGQLPNTFNIPGVEEHGFFLKDVSDARKIRQRIIDCNYYF